MAAKKEIINMPNLAFLVLFGLIGTEIVIHVANTWFGQSLPVFRSGPFILLFVAFAGVFLATVVLKNVWNKTFSKPTIAIMIIAALLIVFVLLQFQGLTNGTLFEPVVQQTASMLGLG